jgi:hypothetical protein
MPQQPPLDLEFQRIFHFDVCLALQFALWGQWLIVARIYEILMTHVVVEMLKRGP